MSDSNIQDGILEDIYQRYQALCAQILTKPNDSAVAVSMFDALLDRAMDHGQSSQQPVTVDAAVAVAQRIDGFKLDGVPGSLQPQHLAETPQEMVPMLISRVLVNHRLGEQGPLLPGTMLLRSKAWHRYVSEYLSIALQASYRLDKIRQDRAYRSAVAA
jgi:hypothetical protein